MHIYVYVDGSDLDEVEGLLMDSFRDFSTSWIGGTFQLINDKYPRTSDMAPDDLPIWNLGINLEVATLSRTEIETLLKFFSKTAIDSNREFVIGKYFPETNITEDMCFVGTDVKQQTIDYLNGQFNAP